MPAAVVPTSSSRSDRSLPTLCRPSLPIEADWPRVSAPGTDKTIRLPPGYAPDQRVWRTRGGNQIRVDTVPTFQYNPDAVAGPCVLAVADGEVYLNVTAEFGGEGSLVLGTSATWEEESGRWIRILGTAFVERDQAEQVTASWSLSR